MDFGVRREDDGRFGGQHEPLYMRRQRSTPFLSTRRSRTPERNSKVMASSSIATNAPKIPRIPTSPNLDGFTKTFETGQQPGMSQRSASNDSYRSGLNSAPHIQNLRHRPSEASRLRVLSNGSAYQQTESRYLSESPSSDDNSTSRGQSLRGTDGVQRQQLAQSSTFPFQVRDEPAARYATPQASRDRGRSTSSSRSTSAFPAIPLRPSTSIPDYASADQLYSRQRNFANFSRPPPRSYVDSSIGNQRREPNMRPMHSEEVRASFRSALTNTSSFLGTSGTERSSVLTKSSATSIFGRDEGMSVDDAIGMYESGFADSGAEESYASRPGSSHSHRSSEVKSSEFKSDSLNVPYPSNLIIRDSTAIFQEPQEDHHLLNGNRTHPDVLLTPKPGDQLDGAVLSRNREESSRPVTPPLSPFDETRDRYGFRKKSQHVSLAQYESWNGPYSEYLARRKKKWLALLKDAGLPTEKPVRFPQKSSKVKRFVRKGIPPDWRGAAWFYYAGGPTMVARHHGLYDQLLQKSANGQLNPTDQELIERDLNRTFPDNIRFKPDPKIPKNADSNGRDSAQTITEPETPILQSLRRVLQAFSIYNPRIGYCQSLNYLAGLLLLFMDEEKSFWILNIITRVYLPGTHEVNLEGANVDLGVLMTSVKESMPSIWTKIGGELDGTTVSSKVSMRLPPITLCCTAWFMSCFIGTLPIETTLRVWDSFFYEGSKTLFRIALAIFKVGETEIRAVNDPMDIFQVVQTIPRRLIDTNALMDACFKRRNGFGHISQETIEERRAERRKGYADERARAAGDVTVERKHGLFSLKRGKGRSADVL